MIRRAALQRIALLAGRLAGLFGWLLLSNVALAGEVVREQFYSPRWAMITLTRCIYPMAMTARRQRPIP